MKNAALSGKPYAGNPHVRFDEGEVASAKPRRGSLLYKAVHAIKLKRMREQMLFWLVILAAMSVTATTVTLQTADEYGQSSFSAKGGWSDGLAPHADADYLVALGEAEGLRTSAGYSVGCETFQGKSLTIGIVGSTAGLIQQKGKRDFVLAIPSLTLANGCYLAGWDVTSAVDRPGTLQAAIDVTAPASMPFKFGLTAGRVLTIEGALTGAEGTGLLIDYSTILNGYFVFRGDCSGYLGSFTISGLGREMVVDEPGVLGGTPTSFLADAIRLRNCGAVRFRKSMTVNPVNRGLTIEPTHGYVWAQGADTTVEFKMPVAGETAGEGGFYKLGSGLLILDVPSWTAGDVHVLSGPLMLDARADAALAAAGRRVVVSATGADVPPGLYPEYDDTTAEPSLVLTNSTTAEIVVDNNVYVATRPGCNVTLGKTTFLGDVKIDCPCDLITGATSCINIDSGCTLGEGETTKFAIRLDANSRVLRRIKVLTVPTSLAELSSENVSITGGEGPLGPDATFEIETDGNGLQSVYVERAWITAVQTIDDDVKNVDNSADCWSDAQAMHNDGLYLIEGIAETRIVRLRGSANPLALVMRGFGVDKPARLMQKASWIRTFKDLYAYGMTEITGAGYVNGKDPMSQGMAGALTVVGDDEHALTIYGAKNRELQLKSTLKGSGTIRVLPQPGTLDAPEYNVYRVGLYGVNTSFKGRIIAEPRDGLEVTDTNNYTQIIVNSDASLGSASPAAFDRLTLKGSSVLTTTSSNVCLGAIAGGVGRGIYAVGMPRVCVPTNATMRIDSKITYNGTLRKTGTGILQLSAGPGWGANAPAPVAGGSRLKIEEGDVMPLSSRVFDGLEVSCAGGRIRFAVSPEDAELAAKGLTGEYGLSFDVSEGPVRIALDNGGAPIGCLTKVALFTVPADKAAALRGKIVCDRPDGWIQAKIVEAQSANGETVTFMAKNGGMGLLLILK